MCKLPPTKREKKVFFYSVSCQNIVRPIGGSLRGKCFNLHPLFSIDSRLRTWLSKYFSNISIVILLEDEDA